MSESAQDWRELMQACAERFVESEAHTKETSLIVWAAARAAILNHDPKSDPTGEKLYADTIEILGRRRKGTASKIKTVALVRQQYGVDLDLFGSLHSAYKAAHRLAVNKPACTCNCHH